jgi:hypothetical protein
VVQEVLETDSAHSYSRPQSPVVSKSTTANIAQVSPLTGKSEDSVNLYDVVSNTNTYAAEEDLEEPPLPPAMTKPSSIQNLLNQEPKKQEKEPEEVADITASPQPQPNLQTQPQALPQVQTHTNPDLTKKNSFSSQKSSHSISLPFPVPPPPAPETQVLEKAPIKEVPQPPKEETVVLAEKKEEQPKSEPKSEPQPSPPIETKGEPRVEPTLQEAPTPAPAPATPTPTSSTPATDPNAEIVIPPLEKRTYGRRSIKMEGWVNLCDEVQPQWAQRWAIFEGGYIWLFEQQQESTARLQTKPKGMIGVNQKSRITKGVNITWELPPIEEKENLFTLEVNATRSIVFSPPQNDYWHWMDALLKASKK